MAHGADLDAELAAALAQADEHPPYPELGPVQARATFRAKALAERAAPEPVAEVTDLTVTGPDGDIAVRRYHPGGDEPMPVVVYFHGGGWTIGDLDTHDAQARQLANGAGALVLSVDYRLAPEHPYPAALQDAVAAVRWAAEQAATTGGDASPLAVAGDSSGGNLAAAVALWARDHGGPPIAAQCLIYPVVNVEDDSDSWAAHGEGYALDAASMAWFNANYVPDPAQRAHPYASPLLAHDLTGLPPAVVAVAGCDILHDQGEAYADRLEAAGVVVRRLCHPSLPHSFFRYGHLSAAAREANAALCRALRDLLVPT